MKFTPRSAAFLAVVAIAYHCFATSALHVLVPSVDPVSEMVGTYLGSEYALLSRSTFLALGIAMVALYMALRGYVRRGPLERTAKILLSIAVIGFVGVTLFPSYARYLAIPTQPSTVVSLLLFSLLLCRLPRWSGIGAWLVVIGLALVGLFVLTVATGILAAAGYGGLVNRIVLVLIYAWIILAAWPLLHDAEARRTASR